jgi:hypothetical protein
VPTAHASVPKAVRRIAWLVAFAGGMAANPAAVRAQAGELESMFVSPSSPTTQDAIVLHAVTACSNPFSGEPSVIGQTITLNTTYFGLYPPCAAGLPPYEVSFNLPSLPAGSYTVNVIGNGGVPDGTVVFTFSFQVVASGDLAAVNPKLEISPGAPTSQEHVRVQAEIDADPSRPGLFPQLVITQAGNRFDISTVGINLSPVPPGPYKSEFDLGALAPGIYQVALTVAGQQAITSFAVSEPAKGLNLQGSRFQVRVLHGTVVQGAAVKGVEAAPAVQISDESGYFWFFASSNMEVTVKLLDGRAVNGHYWLFAASMTAEPFVIEVIDTRGSCTGPSCIRTYASPAGKNKNFIDLAAAN